MPRRPDRTPKHPTGTPGSAAPTATRCSAPAAELGRRLRRGVALTAVVAAVVTGGAVLSAESAGGPTSRRRRPRGGHAPTTRPCRRPPRPSWPAWPSRAATSAPRARTSRTAADRRQGRAARPRGPPRPAGEPDPRPSTLGDPRDIAQAMLADYGWSQSEFSCLDSLWVKESGWDPQAANPTSSAYGIPQALPGSKMATRRRRLGDQPGHADRVGPGLHRRPLRQPLQRLGPLPGQRLVLTSPIGRTPSPRRPVSSPTGPVPRLVPPTNRLDPASASVRASVTGGRSGVRGASCGVRRGRRRAAPR